MSNSRATREAEPKAASPVRASATADWLAVLSLPLWQRELRTYVRVRGERAHLGVAVSPPGNDGWVGSTSAGSILRGNGDATSFPGTDFVGPSDLESAPLGPGDLTNSALAPFRWDYRLVAVQPAPPCMHGSRPSRPGAPRALNRKGRRRRSPPSHRGLRRRHLHCAKGSTPARRPDVATSTPTFAGGRACRFSVEGGSGCAGTNYNAHSSRTYVQGSTRRGGFDVSVPTPHAYAHAFGTVS